MEWEKAQAARWNLFARCLHGDVLLDVFVRLPAGMRRRSNGLLSRPSPTRRWISR